MHKYKSLLFVVMLAALLGSCFEPPEYPVVPNIAFNNVKFVDVDGTQDSLILTFDFQDGDGDIGMDNNDPRFFGPPYHSFNLILDNDGNVVEIGDTSIAFPIYSYESVIIDNQLRIVDRVGEYATSDFAFPTYNCRDYIFISDTQADSLDPDKTDTVLIQQNIYSNNIILDFYRKRNGQYENITKEFSVAQPQCPETFDARFPVFDPGNIGRSLEGSISYALLSSGFKSVFLNDSIKIEFYIFDQALNQSNVISTPDFTLPGLIQNN